MGTHDDRTEALHQTDPEQSTTSPQEDAQTSPAQSLDCGRQMVDLPMDVHLVLLKHLYKHLETTKSMGLLLGGKHHITNRERKGYGDASYADDLRTRYSTGVRYLPPWRTSVLED
jgi:hypothetical protein